MDNPTEKVKKYVEEEDKDSIRAAARNMEREIKKS